MSDYYIPETPVVSRQWCPRCEPDVDQFASILEERLCNFHAPSAKGSDDDAEALRDLRSLSGATESDAETNKAWGDWLRSKRKRSKRK